MATPNKALLSPRLVLALVGSLAAHSLLLLSPAATPPPPPQKVILATLLEPIPHYPKQQKPALAQAETAQTPPAEIAETRPLTSTASPHPAITQPAPEQPLQLPTTAFDSPSANPAPEPIIGLTLGQEQSAVDPLEQSYEQRLLAHLRAHLVAPAELEGHVRLAIQFSYRQIATEVKIVKSSGDPRVDDWAVKAILAANPFPPLPKELKDDYVFRPTLKIGSDS